MWGRSSDAAAFVSDVQGWRRITVCFNVTGDLYRKAPVSAAPAVNLDKHYKFLRVCVSLVFQDVGPTTIVF